ncbi:Bacterial protein of uncharacterised function (DUF883) [Delftia tsuruhatensis]|uniref:hypothetical protein n=1 Tax=Delftia tsuruhatensis TaxID=180282 RepID=UPI001E70A80D|nr:hypothetical protein [Delftia tsuruhatensis]CAB5687929.1 Bacterial protein of uncharacterised function (DUF883) [Delftia tsuruhatensis]CAC9690794.1 Bacterial protein of uncharacterised function (DUF883) [Delftia tsuruhatensis]
MSQTEKAVNKAADAAKEVAQDVTDAAKEAVNTTRRTAASALDKAEEGVQAVERELNPVIDDLAARAQEWATRGINFCADSSDRARRQLQSATEATTRYVIEQPGRSILLAAATGAAIATAFFMSSRSRK